MKTNCPSRTLKITALAFVSAFLLSVAGPLSATEPAKPSAPAPTTSGTVLFSGAVAEVVHLTATVVKIDFQSREVTLKGPQGGVQIVRAGHEVQRLSEIHSGDTVVLDYSETAIVRVGDATGSPEGHDIVDVDRASRSEKPGGSRITKTIISATITAVDKKARTVTLKGPQKSVTLNVDPDSAAFDQVKVGAAVYLEYTQAIAAAVKKSDPAK